METLILWSSKEALPGIARRRGAAAARSLEVAFRRDLLATGIAWQEIHTAADFNRRVVVVVDGADHELVAPAIEAAGARCERAIADGGPGIAHAVAGEFERGARAVAVVGLQAPTLPTYLLDHAFRALQFERLVVGPSFDGGLWLVGSQRAAPSSLAALEPGRPGLLRAVEGALAGAGDAPHLLPFWHTIDDDLAPVAWHLRHLRRDTPGRLPHTWDALVALDAARIPLPPSEG
jgi:glycosyltransferase A (GT-A) superfamily protein (DUF2064 family)